MRGYLENGGTFNWSLGKNGEQTTIEAGVISGNFQKATFVSWKSDNTSIVTISNGVMTLKSEGSANVTATFGDNTVKIQVITGVYMNAVEITVVKSSYVYTGGYIKQVPTVKFNGTTLKNGTAYSLAYSNNKNISTSNIKAQVVIKGKGKYNSISKTIKFDIPAKLLTVTEVASSYVYTGSIIKPSVVVKDGSTILKAGVDYKVTYTTDNTNKLAENTGKIYITSLKSIYLNIPK